MKNKILSLRLFREVARSRNLSSAGRKFQLSQPTTSRVIKELEASLGTRLLVRTTRAVTLTPAGSDYLQRITSVLDALDAASDDARDIGELRGRLRIGLTSDFAVRTLVPRLSPFLSGHPALEVDLLVDENKQDLIGDRIDVALRVGPLADSCAIARRVGSWPLMIAAAPSYLDRAGIPRCPADLSRHAAVLLGACTDASWIFRRDGQQTTVRLDGQIKTTSSDVAIEAARAGAGIFRSIVPVFSNALRDGSLVRLLPDWTMAIVDVHALFPGAQPPKASARAFVDFIEASLRGLDCSIRRA